MISVTAANNTDSPAEVYYPRDNILNREIINLLQYDIKLKIYTNDDYKSTDTYKTFKSYTDEQRAKGNFIFYGESTVFLQIEEKIDNIKMHVQNLKINEAATELIVPLDGEKRLIYTLTEHMYDEKTQTLSIYFGGFVHNFPTSYSYRLNMKFAGSITDNAEGFVKTSYITSKGEKM